MVEKLPLQTIFTNKDKILTTPTQRYAFDDQTPTLIEQMIVSLKEYGGVGIAANQLGLPWTIFALKQVFDPDIVFFNPMIVPIEEEFETDDEGCLSFPNLIVPIKRPKAVRVRYQDEFGQSHAKTFNDLPARIIQHEMMHLDGRFFFEGCNRFHLERAIKNAKNKGTDYSAMGLLKYAKKG